MKYDMAVWEGERPSTDADGLRIFRKMYDEFMNGLVFLPPSERIQCYVESLLQRWPDIGSDAAQESPWADGPLMDNASGDFVYFAMRSGGTRSSADYVAELAGDRGLVCFDPQLGQLR
jgi:hypothetical protein